MSILGQENISEALNLPAPDYITARLDKTSHNEQLNTHGALDVTYEFLYSGWKISGSIPRYILMRLHIAFST
jgi:hypothetical protein